MGYELTEIALLNEAVTLFSVVTTKAGFIIWLTDSTVDEQDVKALRKALKDSKGPGNFRNLFLHSPGGHKDGMKLTPVSEVAAKDEFLIIKEVSRDDLLGSHRLPPQLMGVVLGNVGGFGGSARATEVFDANEMECIRMSLLSIDDREGEEIIRFSKYKLAVSYT
ncbi:hypothetical protein [Pseudoalteromonas rubra]|uniref:hypothetical protein n=1 Tax=Pseudoalteromonas rubra TaxID=43658 RepID=UPI0012DF66FC|nr:hypothetical protein [Pseudoalteromonas rubra]